MNLKQRGSRYGFGVHFAAGAAGVVIIAAGVAQGFKPATEIWLGAGLVAVLIAHARLGFAFSRAQAEIEMLRRLMKRVSEDPAKSARKIMPALNLHDASELTEEDVRILEEVRGAIENQRVELYLQPIVSLPQRKARFYEAFSRLRDAEGRVLRPSAYIDAAERANRIGVIDNMILIRSIQALRKQARRAPRLTVFCNLSPATLYDEQFFGHFVDYLEANTDLASRLVFEFTYPAVQMMHPRVEENLNAIAAKGFTFSIDHVHKFDIDVEALKLRGFAFIKIASSLLTAAHNGDEEQARRLATLRKRLADNEIDLIAEKIEREEDMPALAGLGLDYGQGNLFGPPRQSQFYLACEEDGETPPLAEAS